jgi:hypothetical protein
VRNGRQDEGDCAARQAIERQHRVRGNAGQQAACAAAAKVPAREAIRRLQRAEAELRESKRMLGPSRRREDRILDQIPRAHDGSNEAAVRAIVDPERQRGRRHAALDDCGARLVERVREHRGRLDPLEPVLREREAAEERRRERHRVYRRTDVVDETGQRQLRGAAPAAQGRIGFVHVDRTAGSCEHDGRRQPVRTGSNDEGIWGIGHGFA